MDIEKIQQWLSSKGSYEDGAALYNQAGKNPNLKKLFYRGNTPYNYNKLCHELNQLLNQAPEATPVPVPGPQTTPDDFARHAPLKLQKVSIDELPEELKKLNVEKGRLYQEASHTHAQMAHITNEAERLQYAKKIVLNFDRIDWIWEQLDYWQEHKKIRPGIAKEFDINKATEADLVKHRNNLRALVSKLKNKPKRADDLAKKQKELSDVEAKIKGV